MRYNIDWTIVDLKARNVNSRDARSIVEVENESELTSEIQKHINEFNVDFRHVQRIHVLDESEKLVLTGDVFWSYLESERKYDFYIKWIRE